MNNIWSIILSYTDDPYVYKYTYLTSSMCKRNYKQNKIKEFSNHLLILLKLFPNENWNWILLSGNPAVILDIIKLDYPWNWWSISLRPDLTEDIIRSIDIEWDWRNIYSNLNISKDFIKNNLDKKYNFEDLCNNYYPTFIDIDMSRQYTDIYNKTMTWEIIQNNPNIFNNWYKISINPNITWEIVSQNLDKPWNWYGLSRNPNITCEIINNNLDKPWSWSELVFNKNLTWEFIVQHYDKNWNFNLLSHNKFGCKFEN